MNYAISFFRNAKSTEPAAATLLAFLRNEKHRDKVANVRTATGEERAAAKKQLPAATISGTFSVRNVQGLEKYNGLVCLDFDAKENPGRSVADMKAILSEYEEVLYAGVSCSGEGVFAIIPTNNDDPTEHAALVDILGNIFLESGLKYDRACKDVCRLRFISYDDEAYWNLDAVQFAAKSVLEARRFEENSRRPRPLVFRNPRSNGHSDNYKVVEKWVSAVESTAQDVTNNYDDWLMLGMALATEFGLDGEAFFLRLSQISSKFDHTAAQKKYANLVSTTRSVKIGTFFKILKNHGVKP